MRVLITGGNGFLGSHICDVLASHGHELRLLLRPSSDTEHIAGLRYERIDGDVRNAESLRRATAGVDAVVHCAGLTSALDEAAYAAANAQGTSNVVDASVAANVRRFVYVSSLAARGPSPEGRFVAEAKPAPVSAYGRSKLAGEVGTLAAKDWMSVAVVRPAIVYGPRDRGLLPFFQFVKYRFMPLYKDGSHRLSWIHARDAAEAIVAAVESDGPNGRVYDLADGESYTWLDLAAMLAEAFGRRPVTMPTPPFLFEAAATVAEAVSRLTPLSLPLTREKVLEMRQAYWLSDPSRLEADFGWRPLIEARAGIAETLAWYRAHGWL